MKKIIAITLCMICFLALICIPASAERVDRDSNYYVRVETNPIGRDGAHIDTVYVPHGEKCTLTIDESVKDFVFWNVHGEYEIVAGDYEAKSFTIRPLSDIVAVATYQEAVPHIAVIGTEKPPDMISPQTGYYDKAILIVVVMGIFCIALVSAIVFILRGKDE